MMANQMVGTWRLISFAVQDPEGAIAYPFGREVEGFITYTADGRMAVQFGAANRPPSRSRIGWPAPMRISPRRLATTLPTAAPTRSTTTP